MEQFVVRWNRRYASPVDIFPLTVWLFGHYCEMWVKLPSHSLVRSPAISLCMLAVDSVCRRTRARYILLCSLASKYLHFVHSSVFRCLVCNIWLARLDCCIKFFCIYHGPDERTTAAYCFIVFVPFYIVCNQFLRSSFVWFGLDWLGSVWLGSVCSRSLALLVYQPTILFIVFVWKQRQLFQFCLLQIFITL